MLQLALHGSVMGEVFLPRIAVPWLPEGAPLDIIEGWMVTALDASGAIVSRGGLHPWSIECEGVQRSAVVILDVPKRATTLSITGPSGRALRLAIGLGPSLTVRVAVRPDAPRTLDLTLDVRGDDPLASLQLLVIGADGARWPLYAGRPEPHLCIELDAIPGGDACRVAAVLTQGLRTVTVVTSPLNLASSPAHIAIVSPHFDLPMPTPGILHLRGRAEDVNGRRATEERCEWWLDGAHVGRGLHLRSPLLTPGTHQIRLVLRDARGKELAADERTVVVQSAR